MTPVGRPLRSIMETARDAVRRDASLATAIAVAAVLPAVLLVVWVLSLSVDMTHHVPLAVDVMAILAAVAVGVFASTRWVRRVTDRAVAASAESQHGFAEGELQGVLEMADAPTGTSNALLRHAEQNLANKLGSNAPSVVAGGLARQASRRKLRTLATASVLSMLVVILAFAAPERSRASWSPLLRPVRTIAATALQPLAVKPGNATVSRGSDVDVAVHAAQRDAVVLYWREQGDVLHEVTLPVLSEHAAARIPNVDASVRYWVKAPDGAVSDTFTITPLDPLLISGLSVDVVYPSYLQRSPEHFDKDVPALEVPAGTELRLHGRSTRALESVVLVHETDRVDLSVNGSAFEASWRPRNSGTYMWQLTGKQSVAAAAAPAPLEIKVIDDAPPEIEITYPGVDTILPADMKQMLVADASDDHAVVSATVVSWRVSMTGQRDANVEQPLMLEGEPDRKLVRGSLDATSRQLLPGDTLNYFVRVVDNSPAHQVATSRTFTLRIPGMEEMRDHAQSQAEDLVKDADALAKSMQQLTERTRDLQRKSASGGARSGDRGNGGSPGSESQKQLSSEQAAEAKQVLARQQSLTDDMQKLRDRIENMQRAAQQAGLTDPELQKRMQELKQLYDQLLTPEMKKQMQQLQQALDKLDPDQVQKALEELAKQQEELRNKIDQSLDLMRRAAAEQEMTQLAQEAKELATQQQALSQQMKSDSTNANQNSQQQKEVQKKTDDLSNALAKLQRKLSEQGENNAAGKTGDAQQQTQDAKESMSKAAKEAGQNQTDKAGQSGEQAAGKLDEAAKTLDAARKQMAESWKKETQQSVDNATQDALSLAKMQKDLLDQMQAAKQMGDTPPQQQSGGQSATPTPPSAGQQQGQQQGKQNAGSKENGQKQGGAAGKQGDGQQKTGQQGGTGSAGQPGGNSPSQMQQMRADQAAVKQGLEQLGKNLQDASQRSAMVNRDVGSALARANLSAEETSKALEKATPGNMPDDQASETLDALNRLALELIKNGQQIEQSETGTGVQEALKQLADLAKQQGALNGRSNSLLPLNLGPKTMAQQLSQLAREQRDIADKLGGMNKGGNRDDLLGRLDDLSKEAQQLAQDLQGGRLAPQTLQKQAELFHKLLDAGRTMERDDVSQERKAEAAEPLPPSVVRALRPGLFDENGRYAAPGAEQLKDLPPAYRRLILEYFQKLNAAPAKDASK